MQSGAAYRLSLSREPRSHQQAASRAELAAAQEAQRNASGSNAAGYKMHSADTSGPRSAHAELPAEVVATVIVSSAAQLAQVRLHGNKPSASQPCEAATSLQRSLPAYLFTVCCMNQAHLTGVMCVQDAVKDTTGAGDASVGTLLYGICQGMELPAVMKLAAVVSAAKCTGSGARSALPHRSDIVPDLLS